MLQVKTSWGQSDNQALPRIRVVTVNFNAGPLLTECVKRVAASTVPVDIVVVDNASSDDSLALLQSASIEGVNLRVNIENQGFSRANNLALRDWPGEYVLLLNPDCLVEPDTLERVISEVEIQPNAGMAGCLILNPDGSEQSGCRRLDPTPDLVLKYMLGRAPLSLAGSLLPGMSVSVEAISGAFMLIRTAAMEQVGLLDEGYFMHCEDLDWCHRFRSAGWDILFVPTVAVTHVKGACSGNRAIRVEWHKHRGLIRYYHKFFRVGYPRILLWLIYLAVGFRFGVKSLLMLLRSKG